jgi:protein-S-isoprenylcysteine O-methyltransferase Ste14
MTAATEPHRCAAECTLRARVGAVLFRRRSWLPVPLALLLFLVPTDVDPTTVLLGALIALAGMATRAAGVAAAGTTTRRRSRAVARLVTHGVFSWVRNPLYIGNLLLWGGVLVATEAWLLAPGAIVAFAIAYAFIVWYEEGVLESMFGDEYLSYKATVPRWIPRRPTTRVDGERDWDAAWRKEWHSAAAFALITVAMMIKELIIQRPL